MSLYSNVVDRVSLNLFGFDINFKVLDPVTNHGEALYSYDERTGCNNKGLTLYYIFSYIIWKKGVNIAPIVIRDLIKQELEKEIMIDDMEEIVDLSVIEFTVKYLKKVFNYNIQLCIFDENLNSMFSTSKEQEFQFGKYNFQELEILMVKNEKWFILDQTTEEYCKFMEWVGEMENLVKKEEDKKIKYYIYKTRKLLQKEKWHSAERYEFEDLKRYAEIYQIKEIQYLIQNIINKQIKTKIQKIRTEMQTELQSVKCIMANKEVVNKEEDFMENEDYGYDEEFNRINNEYCGYNDDSYYI